MKFFIKNCKSAENCDIHQVQQSSSLFIIFHHDSFLWFRSFITSKICDRNQHYEWVMNDDFDVRVCSSSLWDFLIRREKLYSVSDRPKREKVMADPSARAQERCFFPRPSASIGTGSPWFEDPTSRRSILLCACAVGGVGVTSEVTRRNRLTRFFFHVFMREAVFKFRPTIA